MTSMSPIHVQLVAMSPTSNTIEPKQRLRQLRPTRKLKPVTPLFLDLDSKVHIKPKASPRTRAIRRKGQVFNSPTSTSAIESDDFFINTRSGISSSRSSPPSVKPVTQGRSETSPETNGNKKGPQCLTQPFLLQLRSVPVPPIKSRIPFDGQSKTPSPVSSSCNIDMDATSAPLPTQHTLTESEKLRKLAKLARTLGENVPPELVFRSPPLQRTTSLSVSRPKMSPSSHKQSHSIATPSSPAPQPLRKQRSTSTMATPSDVVETRASTSFSTSIDPPTAVEPKNRPDILSFESEWGRRKEREWSGEWNVKDMKYVVNALRDLKGR